MILMTLEHLPFDENCVHCCKLGSGVKSGRVYMLFLLGTCEDHWYPWTAMHSLAVETVGSLPE